MFYAKWSGKEAIFILENMACSKYQEKTREYTKLATKSETIICKLIVNIGIRKKKKTTTKKKHRHTGQGCEGGPPLKILGNSDFLGSNRKFGQSRFSRSIHIYLIILKTWILTWSRRNNAFTFTRDCSQCQGKAPLLKQIEMFTKLLTRAPWYRLIKSFFLAIGESYLHNLSHTFLKRLILLWG